MNFAYRTIWAKPGGFRDFGRNFEVRGRAYSGKGRCLDTLYVFAPGDYDEPHEDYRLVKR